MKANHTSIRFMIIILIVSISTLTGKSQVADSSIRQPILHIQNPMDQLMTLKPSVYRYAPGEYTGIRLPAGKQYGFLPENMEKAFPELVGYQDFNYTTGKNMFRTAKVKMVQLERLTPILVAAIQEQQREIEAIKKELLKLRQEMAAL